MAHALNLTMKIRQDAAALATLAALKADFKTKYQPMIAAALAESERVHFARLLVIDDLYLQVLTEYDGSHEEYTEFFRRKLPEVFALLFSMAENVPDSAALGDEKAFFDFAAGLQYRALGDATDGSLDQDEKLAGWLFSAYPGSEVKDIKAALKA